MERYSSSGSIREEEDAMQKRWVKPVIAAAVLVIAVLAMIPFFVNADTFRPKIQVDLSSSLGRAVTMGHISLSLFTGSLVARDISIADDPAFATTPFLVAKELRIGVALGPLIFHRSVQITNFDRRLSVDPTYPRSQREMEFLLAGRQRFSGTIAADGRAAFPHGKRAQDREWQRCAFFCPRSRQALHVQRR